MGNVNCLRCRFRHEDNGNCTAVGGFCTAVPAAHCPMLREYLDTGLTPEEITAMQHTLDEYRKVADPLLRAQADGRVVVHGRWVPTKAPFMNECKDCSVCGYRTVWGHRYNYCPNCGAKMDGGDSDEAD